MTGAAGDPAASDVLVVVLAGGEGLRMGGDKPLRRVCGRPLIDHVLEAARRYGPRVAVAVRSPDQAVGQGGVEAVYDLPGPGGPIGGLGAALQHARRLGAEMVLTLPCDTPRLPADLLARLRAAMGPGKAAVARSHGRAHPACALWRSEAAAGWAAYAASGRSSLWGFAESLGVAWADWGETQPDPFLNLNTDEDVAAFERLAALEA